MRVEARPLLEWSGRRMLGRWPRIPGRSIGAHALAVRHGERMSEHVIKPLNADTWDAYARFVDRHNGVSGGCWCTWFHTMHGEKTFTAEGNRRSSTSSSSKAEPRRARLRWDEAVAWCQYGAPAELPNIYHRKEYEATLDVTPDYRITCLFVDKHARRTGLSLVALRGALDLIARAGGGIVEAYPHDTGGGKVSNLYNGTRTLFESAGFTYIRPKGSRNCVMRTELT